MINIIILQLRFLPMFNSIKVNYLFWYLDGWVVHILTFWWQRIRLTSYKFFISTLVKFLIIFCLLHKILFHVQINLRQNIVIFIRFFLFCADISCIYTIKPFWTQRWRIINFIWRVYYIRFGCQMTQIKIILFSLEVIVFIHFL